MHRRTRDCIRRGIEPRRSTGYRHAHRCRRGGCDRRKGALRRVFHASTGTRGGRRVGMTLRTTDLDGLVAEAAKILDHAAKQFIEGRGADSAVRKKGNDFATEVDLAIERDVVEALTSATGIDVHG